LLERLLHGFKNRLYGHFGFGFGDAGSVYDLVNDVQLDQNGLLLRASGVRAGRVLVPASVNHMIGLNLYSCQATGLWGARRRSQAMNSGAPADALRRGSR